MDSQSLRQTIEANIAEIEAAVRLRDGEVNAIIAEHERYKAEHEGIVKGLRSALSLVPSHESNGAVSSPSGVARSFRVGSAPYKVRRMILKSGLPVHVDDALIRLGQSVNAKSRRSLASTLGTYARAGEVFVKVKPRTFGLLELGHKVEEDGDDDDFEQLSLGDGNEPLSGE